MFLSLPSSFIRAFHCLWACEISLKLKNAIFSGCSWQMYEHFLQLHSKLMDDYFQRFQIFWFWLETRVHRDAGLERSLMHSFLCWWNILSWFVRFILMSNHLLLHAIYFSLTAHHQKITSSVSQTSGLEL